MQKLRCPVEWLHTQLLWLWISKLPSLEILNSWLLSAALLPWKNTYFRFQEYVSFVQNMVYFMRKFCAEQVTEVDWHLVVFFFPLSYWYAVFDLTCVLNGSARGRYIVSNSTWGKLCYCRNFLGSFWDASSSARPSLTFLSISESLFFVGLGGLFQFNISVIPTICYLEIP